MIPKLLEVQQMNGNEEILRYVSQSTAPSRRGRATCGEHEAAEDGRDPGDVGHGALEVVDPGQGQEAHAREDAVAESQHQERRGHHQPTPAAVGRGRQRRSPATLPTRHDGVD